MFKIWNRKIYILVIFTLLGLSYVSYNYIYASNFLDFKNKIQEKIVELNSSDPINSLAGKKVTIDLFDSSMEILREQAAQNTQNSLRDTTKLLNDKYLCELKEDELASILYFTQADFRSQVEEVILKGEDLRYNINQEQVKQACKKFLLCKNPKLTELDKYVVSVQAIDTCSSEILQRYFKVKANTTYIQNAYMDTYGKELFWNNDLDDSGYDIMRDLYEVSRLMFEDVEEPQTMIFYEIPYLPIPRINDTESYENRRDRFNPNRETDRMREQNEREKSLEKVERDKKKESFDEYYNGKKEDGKDNALGKQNSKLGDSVGESCQPITESPLSDNITHIKKLYEYTNEEQEQAAKQIVDYTDDLQNKLEESICNNNGICEANENTSCGDCRSSNTDTSGPQGIDDIESITSLDDLNDVKSCIKGCNSIKSVTDKALCVLQCSCKLYESKIREDLPELGKLYRIRFCFMPPEPTQTPKTKKVYSISTILVHIRDTLKALRNSGQLNVQNITREAIDTANKDLDVGSQSIFTLTFETRPLFGNESQRTKKDKAYELADRIAFMGFEASKEPQDAIQINKYAVMADLPSILAKERGFDSTEEKETLENRYVTMKPENNRDMLHMQSIQELNRHKIEQMWEFLDYNVKFWYDNKKKFEDFNQGIEAFSKK